MTVRLTLFGLITSLFVGLVYVMTKPVIIEAKEQARQEKLLLLLGVADFLSLTGPLPRICTPRDRVRTHLRVLTGRS